MDSYTIDPHELAPDGAQTAIVASAAQIPHDDQTYTGDVSASPFSMDYFRAKYLEFQQALTAGDRAYQAGVAAYFATDPPDAGLYDLLMEYESKAGEYKSTAESLNLGAQIVNSMGGRLPALSIPSSLGALPALALPIGVILAVSSAVGAVAYMVGFTAGMQAQLERVKAMPENATKPEIVAALTEAVAARQQMGLNPLSGISGVLGGYVGLVKIVIIGGLAWMAWRAFDDATNR